VTPQSNLGGTFTFPNTRVTVNRMGYGAMQLAGRDGKKVVWGPPRDVPEALAVLRAAVDAGVNHIDTSDYYGPHVTNQLIKEALHPYPEGLVIVTKVARGGTAMVVGRTLGSGRRLSMRCTIICGTWGSTQWMW